MTLHPELRRFWHDKAPVIIGVAILFALSFSGSAMIALSYRDGAYSIDDPAGIAQTPSRTTPDPDDFTFIFVNQNRGLMRYDGYVYYMRPGDVLPDGGRIVRFGIDPEISEPPNTSIYQPAV